MDERSIRLEALTKAWPDGTLALDGVSLTVPPGEVVAILGRSGAGKSTLLRCACLLIPPTSGRAFVGPTELTALRGRALARARGRVGFVFQQFNLIRSFTARDNVLTARMTHVSWLRGLLGLWTAHDRDLAARCLQDVGLGDKGGSLARELSGGQQQRVAVARAFAQEPWALFADEPTASLDPTLAATVLGLLRAYGKDRGVPVLMNVHTVEHARRFSDRVVGLRAGRVVHDGPSSELSEEHLATVYAADPKEDG